ncbi:hypothetical protein [Streptomyces microflavus]
MMLVLGTLAWAAQIIGPGLLLLAAGVAVAYFLLSAPLRCIALGVRGGVATMPRGFYGDAGSGNTSGRVSRR